MAIRYCKEWLIQSFTTSLFFWEIRLSESHVWLFDLSETSSSPSRSPLLVVRVHVCFPDHVAAFLTQNVNVDNVTIKFEIWDTAGQGKHWRVRFIGRALQKLGSHVLQRCCGCCRRVRYHEPRNGVFES